MSWLARIPGLGSLAGRLSWLIIGVLLLTQSVAFFVYFSESETQYYELQGDERIRRMVAVMNAVEGKHMRHQDAILDAVSDEEFMLYIDGLVLPPSQLKQPELLKQRQHLRALAKREAHIILLGDLVHSTNREHQLLLEDMGGGAEALVLAAIPLRDGSWLYGTLYDQQGALLDELGYELLYSIPVFLLVAGVIVFSVRRLTQPLSLLADKAVRFGRGEAFRPLPLQGTQEVQRATGAFNEMAERLERHVADRQQLFAAISHDLRSPLTGMRIQAEFIADEQVRDSMIAGVEEMQQMISSVLDFTRDDAAAEPVVDVAVNQLLRDLVQHYQSQQQDVSFSSLAATEEAAYVVKTRPLALKRVLRNVLENALKYGQRAEVAVAIEGDCLLIVVKDEGPGIPEKDLERVFEPFTQLDDSRPAARSGVGMGLSVVRSLVRAMGGEVRLANRCGAQRGLRVSIQLPR